MERNRWLSLTLRTALLVLFFWMIWDLLMPIALGGLFALLLSPLLERVRPRLGRAARFAPLLFILGVIGLVMVPFVFITIELAQAIQQLVSRDWAPTIASVQAYLTNGIDIGGRHFDLGGPTLRAGIQNLGERVASLAASGLGSMARALPALILSFFLFSVSLYYFLRDGDRLVRWLLRLSPFPEAQTRELFASIRQTVNGAILGILATALVQGLLTILALYVFGVPNALLLGVLAALLSFIPLVGTTPVTGGGAIYLFATGHVGAGLGMLVAALVIGLSDNVVRPWVQSSSTSMHPLVALLSLFGGLAFFGAAGVFLGPVVAAMAVWTVETYARLHPPLAEAAEPPGAEPPTAVVPAP
jgi:predicted PurR-regulated permease PerM